MNVTIFAARSFLPRALFAMADAQIVALVETGQEAIDSMLVQ